MEADETNLAPTDGWVCGALDSPSLMIRIASVSSVVSVVGMASGAQADAKSSLTTAAPSQTLARLRDISEEERLSCEKLRISR